MAEPSAKAREHALAKAKLSTDIVEAMIPLCRTDKLEAICQVLMELDTGKLKSLLSIVKSP